MEKLLMDLRASVSGKQRELVELQERQQRLDKEMVLAKDKLEHARAQMVPLRSALAKVASSEHLQALDDYLDKRSLAPRIETQVAQLSELIGNF